MPTRILREINSAKINQLLEAKRWIIPKGCHHGKIVSSRYVNGNLTKRRHNFADAISKVHDSVREGESIVQPLEASGVFPPMVISMIDVGEETGQLPEMLLKVADVYDDEVDNAVTGLTSLLEPVMIVFLAVVVGTIVIALFLPLISIITGMQNQ